MNIYFGWFVKVKIIKIVIINLQIYDLLEVNDGMESKGYFYNKYFV